MTGKAIVKLHMESLSDYETLSKEMFEHIKEVEGNSGDTTGVAKALVKELTGQQGEIVETKVKLADKWVKSVWRF